MKVRNARLLLLLLLSSLNFPLLAQPKKITAIKVEDPELYFAFYQNHAIVDNKIQTSSAVAASSLSSSTAALYGVNATDFQKLTTQIRNFEVSLGAWLQQEQYYVAQQRAAKKRPDMSVLANYQRQRHRLVMNAHANIHQNLTPNGWASLYSYVNGSFKASQPLTAGAAK